MKRSRSGYRSSTRCSVSRIPFATRARPTIANRCGGSWVHSQTAAISVLTGLLLRGEIGRLDRLLDGAEGPKHGVEVRDAEDRRDALLRADEVEPPSLALQPLEAADEDSHRRRIEMLE